MNKRYCTYYFNACSQSQVANYPKRQDFHKSRGSRNVDGKRKKIPVYDDSSCYVHVSCTVMLFSHLSIICIPIYVYHVFSLASPSLE
jgi:hypothetical protein